MFLVDVRKSERMVAARNCEGRAEIQSKICYDTYKDLEKQDGCDPFTIYSFNKREITISSQNT